jgi:hypothetical protein
VVEESEITCEHNDHARIPAAHVGDCSRDDVIQTSYRIRMKSMKPKLVFPESSQNAIRSSWHDLSLTYVDSQSCIAGVQKGE